jgi:hypothetical protein
MRVCRRAEDLVDVSDSEVLVMSVAPDSEGTARNLAKLQKIM